MEDRCYAPYPTSMFSQLDRIRELAEDSGIVKAVPEPEFDAAEEIMRGDKTDEEDRVETEDGQSPPSKKIRRQLSEAKLSENGGSPPSNVLENNESDILGFNALESVLKTNFASDENDKRLQFCETTLVPSCLQHKSKYAELFKPLMGFIETECPTSAIVFAAGLVKEIEFETFVKTVIEKDLLTENQERILLEKWIYNNSIDGTSPIFEAVASRQPNIFEDSSLMEIVLRNMINNLSPQKDKCPKYSKFLLQIITKIPSNLSELVYSNLKSLVDSNKTFLKKRMDQELQRKSH